MADLQSANHSSQPVAPPGTSGNSASSLTAPLTGTGNNGCAGLRETDPDLARVVELWPELPVHIRATILTLVQAAPTTDRSSVPARATFARANRTPS
jgi:hypothetical protein